MKNINDTYFDGLYKDVWRSFTPEGMTKAEVEFLVQSCALTPEKKVLDLMCGYGRHAVALARNGIHVTAVDNLVDYVDEIRDVASKENLPVSVIQSDVTQYQPDEKFDLVICMGNSLSFFNAEDTAALFQMISTSLKPFGKFIFSSWMIAEIAIKQFVDKSWGYVDDLKILADNKYLFSPTRIETESILITHDGKTEMKKAIDYIYSINETETMLRQVGLRMCECWSIPGRRSFSIGERQIYVSAQKF